MCRKLADSLNQEFQELHFAHYRCGAHIINLAVQNALKMLKTDNIDKQDLELNESNAPVSDLVSKVSFYLYIFKTI